MRERYINFINFIFLFLVNLIIKQDHLSINFIYYNLITIARFNLLIIKFSVLIEQFPDNINLFIIMKLLIHDLFKEFKFIEPSFLITVFSFQLTIIQFHYNWISLIH